MGWRCVCPVIAAAMLGGGLGCSAEGASGRPTAHLTGTVTIDGKPIPDDATGTVDFHPASGGQAHPASAVIDGDKYDCPDVPIGDVIVFFNITRPTGRMIREDGGSPFPERENLVPEQVQQGMTIQVTGDGERNFEL